MKTPIAARTLGITYSHLFSLIHHGKLSPPDKDTSGDYVWTPADLERARKVLAKRRRAVARV